MIRVKRAYEPAKTTDGHRILVDRLWPRGVRKDKLKIDEWWPELAPSVPLRRWFKHDPAKWVGFRRKYFEELEGSGAVCCKKLLHLAANEDVTLIFAARDEEHNNAVALKEFLDGRTAKG